MKQSEWNVYQKCRLFAGCDRAELDAILQKAGAYENSLLPGEAAVFQTEAGGRIGIVLSGVLNVMSSPQSGSVLNRLSSGDVFGVSVLYQETGAGTVILCQKASRVLYLDARRMEPLWENAQLRKNLICFLTDRIRFLNRKIACFTAQDAVGKLARYLMENTSAEGVCDTFGSFAHLSRLLDLGRASLYRALEELERKGILEKGPKQIRVLSCEKLNLFQ